MFFRPKIVRMITVRLAGNVAQRGGSKIHSEFWW